MYDIDLELVASLSVSMLIVGIGMTVLPTIYLKIKHKGSDYIHVVMISALLFIVITASQAYYAVKTNPDLLYPMVLVTLGFRILSPKIFVETMQEKHGEKESWKKIKVFLLLVSLGLIFYTFTSGMTNKTNDDIAVSERLIMTIAVTYTYAKAYHKIIQKFLLDRGEVDRYILVSGFLISIAFVILIPFLVPEFDRAYKLTGTIGWLGAFLAMKYGSAFTEIKEKETDDKPEKNRLNGEDSTGVNENGMDYGNIGNKLHFDDGMNKSFTRKTVTEGEREWMLGKKSE